MRANEPFSNTKIKKQLNLILSTPAFKKARILSAFLEFVIDQTLAGKGQEIKEYIIGLKVLSRPGDFNPQLDPIVRIHAGRLRRALKEYYYETGKCDPIFIEIPKGSYIATFHAPESVEHTKSNGTIEIKRNRPIVAVLPFRNISNDTSRDFFADGLGEQLSNELTRFHDLSVISYFSSRHAAGKTSDVKEAAILLGAKYILTGSIQNDLHHLRIWVQLILSENGEQLWANSFEKDNTAIGLFEIQNEIVRSILTAIGGYYGVIFRDIMGAPHGNGTNSIKIYDAIFWYYHYQKVFTTEAFEKTVSALEDAVKADPDYALAWAMLGELYLDDKALDFKQIDDPIQKGLKCGLRAAKIDPNCQHAYQTLAWAYLFLHNVEECVKAVDQCLAINPNSSDKVGAMGFGLICAGEFDRGFKLLNDSIRQNPYYPWWFNLGFASYFLYHKEYVNALHSAEKIGTPDLLWDPLLKACALGHLGRTVEAGKYLNLLTQIIPDAANQVKIIVASFLLSPELNREIVIGLQKAGLDLVYQPTDVEWKS